MLGSRVLPISLIFRNGFPKVGGFTWPQKTLLKCGDAVVVWWTPGKVYKPGRGSDFFVGQTAGVVGNKFNLEKGHPAPRPLNQMFALVSFSRPGGIVLDPFMGSGTTGVACTRMERSFIGIEKDPVYFEIACTRIKEAHERLLWTLWLLVLCQLSLHYEILLARVR